MKKILIIAGEVSGDTHAADLVTALREKNPDLKFIGIGGDKMEKAGVEILYHISQFSILGFVEILRHLPFIRKVIRQLTKLIEKEIDAVILVDYPGFNLRMARIAKGRGLPVIYYICPQMWAWGEGRIEKFKRFVDLPIVIFKFEEEFFRKHGITAHFVGHPLLDQIIENISESEFREKYGITNSVYPIGLFPGSRENEVKHLLPIMLESVRFLNREFEIIPLIAKAPHMNREVYESFLMENEKSSLIYSDVHNLMKFSYVALVASGTATLELGYFQTPSIVLYKVSPISYFIGKLLVKIKNIALTNIVLEKTVFPEFIQNQATADNIIQAISKYFVDNNYYQEVKDNLKQVKGILGEPGGSQRASTLILDYLKNQYSQ
jgi:lipid-A-disaccharide synthase